MRKINREDMLELTRRMTVSYTHLIALNADTVNDEDIVIHY